MIIDSDGLDPVFGRLEELLVIGGDMVIFVVSLCKVYFDPHYHAYVINVTSHRSLTSKVLDRNVYHGHKLAGGNTFITFKHVFLL